MYALQRTGSPESVLAEVSARYGVEGVAERTEYFDEQYPSYVVGPEDGSAPSVTISWVGTANWWFSNPGGYPQVTRDDETEFVEPLVEDSLAPGEAEARALAQEAFAATGLEVAPGDITVMVDPYQTMASAYLTVDGVATALDWGIAWSAQTGELVWAYGHAIEVVERGTFDTVSAVAAVDRLSDWRWFGAAGPDYQGGYSILAAESGVARDAIAGDPDAPVSSPEGSEPGEPGVGEPGFGVGKAVLERGTVAGVRGLYRSASGDPLHVIVSENFLSLGAVAPGQPIVVQIFGGFLPVVPVGTVGLFPTLDPGSRPFMVIDVESLLGFVELRGLVNISANEIFVDIDPEGHAATARRIRQVFRAGSLLDREARIEDSVIDPLTVAG